MMCYCHCIINEKTLKFRAILAIIILFFRKRIKEHSTTEGKLNRYVCSIVNECKLRILLHELKCRFNGFTSK